MKIQCFTKTDGTHETKQKKNEKKKQKNLSCVSLANSLCTERFMYRSKRDWISGIETKNEKDEMIKKYGTMIADEKNVCTRSTTIMAKNVILISFTIIYTSMTKNKKNRWLRRLKTFQCRGKTLFSSFCLVLFFFVYTVSFLVIVWWDKKIIFACG